MTQAITHYLKKDTPNPTLLVGYDTRFASRNFAQQVPDVLTTNDVQVQLLSNSIPTPSVSFSTIHRKLDGAINITASHNPGEYNGLKFSGPNGSIALPRITEVIEREIERLQQSGWEFSASLSPSLIELVDLRDEYLSELRSKVDFDKIRSPRNTRWLQVHWQIYQGSSNHLGWRIKCRPSDSGSYPRKGWNLSVSADRRNGRLSWEVIERTAENPF